MSIAPTNIMGIELEGQFGFKDGGQFNLSFQSNLKFTVEKS